MQSGLNVFSHSQHFSLLFFHSHRLSLFLLRLTAQMAEWYRASVSGAVDSGMIPNRVKPMTLKLVFTASQLDAQF